MSFADHCEVNYDCNCEICNPLQIDVDEEEQYEVPFISDLDPDWDYDYYYDDEGNYRFPEELD